MRALLTLLLLSSSACTKNHEALRTRQAELDRLLSDSMLRADNLNEERKAHDALEEELRKGLEELPSAREALAALDAEPELPSAVSPTPPPLPPVSLFEGSDGARMRARLADTEARLAQLRKVLGEVERLDARNGC